MPQVKCYGVVGSSKNNGINLHKKLLPGSLPCLAVGRGFHQRIPVICAKAVICGNTISILFALQISPHL